MARIAEAEGVTPKQLADDLEVTTGAITAITNSLVAKGLIVRLENPRDRRSLVMKLTDPGHSVMEVAYRQYQDALTETSQTLGPVEEAAFVQALTLLTSTISSAK